ncbi:MAG: PIG-L family deacetylase [Chthonomonas sp.]|nr:PIG-L family deacetylase [Chthonomonas sp.]
MAKQLGFQRVLVLAPHTDDAELGAGATLARLQQEGAAITSVAFSDCRESVPAGFDPLVLRQEIVAAHTQLGIKDVRVLDFNVRYFPRDRQEILEAMVALVKELQPDLVLCPMRSDIHQDHQVIAQEAIRAGKKSTIWGFELPWNNLTLDNPLFVEVSEDQLMAKVRALAAYESQGFRSYSNEATLRSLAHVRGIQSGYALAESFEVIRWKVSL